MQILNLLSKPTTIKNDVNYSSEDSSDDESDDKSMPMRRNQVKMSFSEIRKFRNFDHKSIIHNPAHNPIHEPIHEEAFNSDLGFSTESVSSMRSKAEAKHIKRMASKFSPVYINSKQKQPAKKKAIPTKSISRQLK